LLTTHHLLKYKQYYAIVTSQNQSAEMAEHTESPSVLGNPIEICIVTRDYKRTITGLWQVGIGPWRVYTFTPSNTTNQTYRGKPSEFILRVCFAELAHPWRMR